MYWSSVKDINENSIESVAAADRTMQPAKPSSFVASSWNTTLNYDMTEVTSVYNYELVKAIFSSRKLTREEAEALGNAVNATQTYAAVLCFGLAAASKLRPLCKGMKYVGIGK